MYIAVKYLMSIVEKNSLECQVEYRINNKLPVFRRLKKRVGTIQGSCWALSRSLRCGQVPSPLVPFV